MSKPDSMYTRLPGRGKKFSLLYAESQRLYLADDHLLVLQNNRAEETHKKFYYNDIQAITVKTNFDRLYWILFFLILLFFVGGMALLVSTVSADFPLGGYLYFSLLAMIPIVRIAWDILRGPTCTVRIHTAVQVQELTALRRLSRARKSLVLLNARIEQAQGVWQANEGESPLFDPNNVQATRSLPKQFKKTEIKMLTGTLHRIAFAGVLLVGVSTLIDLVARHWIKNSFDTIALFIVVTLLFVGVIRQHNTTLPHRVKTWTWVTLITMGVFATAFISFTAFIDALNMDSENPPPVFAIQDLSVMEDEPWFDVWLVVYGGVHCFLGAIGLMQLRGYQNRENSSVTGESVIEDIDPQ